MTAINRRKALTMIGGATFTGLAGCLGGLGGGSEEDFPTRDIRTIVPYGPGGGVDAYAQGYTPVVSDELGVNIEIDHIEGAAGLRGLGELAGADPNGYTIGQASPPAEILPALLEDPGFDQRELTGIARVGYSSLTGIVNADHGIESYTDLVDAYQSGEFSQCAGLGEGGQQHAAALTARDTHGLDFDSYVAYGGTGQVEEAVVSNEVPFGFGTDAGFRSAVESDSAYPVAILSAEPSGVFPDWPTVTDEGFEDISFIGVLHRMWMAPPDTPDDIQQTLQDAFEAAANSDQIEQWSEDTGNAITFDDGEEAEQMIETMFEEIPANVDMEELGGS